MTRLNGFIMLAVSLAIVVCISTSCLGGEQKSGLLCERVSKWTNTKDLKAATNGLAQFHMKDQFQHKSACKSCCLKHHFRYSHLEHKSQCQCTNELVELTTMKKQHRPGAIPGLRFRY